MRFPTLAMAAALAALTLAIPYSNGATQKAAAKKPPAKKPVTRKPPAKKAPPKKTTAKSRRRAVPAAPRVSATARAAAAERVDHYLNSSATLGFAQPGALAPVFEQLFQLGTGAKTDALHLLHFGDSHTAADTWTGHLRTLLKQRFGDGGAGFSLAGHPFAGYRRFDARGGATTGWITHGLRSATGDGFFGLGGVSIETDRAGQSIFMEAECSHLEIHFLKQPDGGDLGLYEDDRLLDQFSTAGELGPGAIRYDATPGEHRFVLKTLTSRPVRLFGWVADRDTGLTYEALGINGAEAGVMLRWDEQMLATYLQRRNPALIMLAYGTNEASDPNLTPESYGALLSTLLQKLRAAAPVASIVVLGPPDRWSRSKGTWSPLPGVDGIIAAQQATCRENRCAFWDARRRMGGKGSMRDWVYAGLAQGDYVHLTSAGYIKLAEALYDDLMRGYETYRKTRNALTDQEHGKPN